MGRSYPSLIFGQEPDKFEPDLAKPENKWTVRANPIYPTPPTAIFSFPLCYVHTSHVNGSRGVSVVNLVPNFLFLIHGNKSTINPDLGGIDIFCESFLKSS